MTVTNATFWNDICTGEWAATFPSLAAFDRAYLTLYPWLHKFATQHAAGRVLEVGPGYGTIGRLLNPLCDYTAIDIAPNVVAHTRGWGGSALVASILDAPFPDNTFDTIVAIGSLHHTGNLNEAISECRRILKPQGWLSAMIYGTDGGTRDWNRHGPAPHTQHTSPADIPVLFYNWTDVTVTIHRPHDLDDLYIHARKP